MPRRMNHLQLKSGLQFNAVTIRNLLINSHITPHQSIKFFCRTLVSL